MKNNIALYLTKIGFFAMLLYSVFFLAILRVQIQNMTMLLGGITALFMAVDMILNNFNIEKLLVKEVIILIGFLLYSVFTAILFAAYKGSALDGIFQLFQNLILLIVTIYIIVRDQNIKFVALAFIIVMTVMAVYALGNMEEFDTRLSLTEETNANVLGHNAMCALMLLPLFIKPKKTCLNALLIVCASIFITTIVLSSSRMSFICLIVFAFLFFIKIYPMAFNRLRSSSRGLQVAIGLLVLLVVGYLFLSQLEGTLMYERLQSLFDVMDTGEGDGQGRIYLYNKAWKFFKENPLFGVGYANFAPKNYGAYSHSTYAEILACSGIFGSIIYIVFYWSMYKNVKKQTLSKGNNSEEIIRLTMMVALLVIIVLGIGEIVFYKINYYIIFGLIIGYGIISDEGRKTDEKNKGFTNSI